jgi:hypothetical protein
MPLPAMGHCEAWDLGATHRADAPTHAASARRRRRPAKGAQHTQDGQLSPCDQPSGER